MGILKKVKKKIYNSNLVQREYKKYSLASAKPANQDNYVFHKGTDKYYLVKTAFGDIFFNLDDENLENDVVANLLKKSDNNYFIDEATLLVNFLNPKENSVGGGNALLDLGANLGTISFPFAKAGYKVFGFEGNALNCKQLNRTKDFNGFDCNFYNVAVTDISGNYKFISKGPWGHLVKDAGDEEGNPIKGISIDDWYEQNPFAEDVAIMKIDIEGGELAALKGMQKFLKAKNYPMLYVESCMWLLGYQDLTPRDFVKEFEAIGYETYLLKDAQTVEKFNNDFQLEPVTDFLFVHKSNLDFLQTKTVINQTNSIKDFYKAASSLAPLFQEYFRSFALQILKLKELQDAEYLDEFLKLEISFDNQEAKDVYNKLLDLRKEM